MNTNLKMAEQSADWVDDLTSKQADRAIFLPAISSFYSAIIGRQRHDPTKIPPNRIPANFENGIEGMNWLNAKEAYFPYKWSLYSAGHAEIDMNKFAPGEDVFRNRDRSNSFVLGDSGGFQIAKGVWEADWKDINCPRAQKKRELVLTWMDACMDYGMILDVPVWATSDAKAVAASGISTYEEAVTATDINNQYFLKNRTGQCKLLNVLQGGDHTESKDWYDRMKHYSDPKQHSNYFEGWSMGGQNKSDIHVLIQRLVDMKFDGLLESGQHDWVHILGTSKLEWAVLLTDIQRAIRKHHNETLTVSFDCASPFLASANGGLYTNVVCPPNKRWTQRTLTAIDHKKYATDTRIFGDAIAQDKLYSAFIDSPVSRRILMNDVCHYNAGDLNKIGKEGKTSWDCFSYFLQMGHNVWSHINAVQEANRQYENGIRPAMMDSTISGKVHRFYADRFCTDIIDSIFATSDRGSADKLIEEYNAYWMSVVGSGQTTGKNTVNSKTSYRSLFNEAQGEPTIEYHSDDSGFDESPLDNLESGEMDD